MSTFGATLFGPLSDIPTYPAELGELMSDEAVSDSVSLPAAGDGVTSASSEANSVESYLYPDLLISCERVEMEPTLPVEPRS
jgi:hypothetical protein